MNAGPPRRPDVVGLPVAYGLELFKNRTREQGLIGGHLADPAIRVVTVTGRRGIGKSAVAAKIMDTLAGGQWPGRAEAPPPWGLINLSTRTSGISLQRVYFDCARMLGGAQEERLLEGWQERRSPSDKIDELFAAMDDRLIIILLDNLEDLLRDDGRVDDEGLAAFFDCVFRARSTPRVLVTSQVPPRFAPEVRRYAAEVELSEGLPPDDAVALLREFDRDGSLGVAGLPDEELLNAAVRVHGVPRALELLVGAVADDTLTLPTLREVATDFTLRSDVVAGLAQDRYRRLDPDSRAVLNVLAVLGTSATLDVVEWIVGGLTSEIDVAPVLSHLARLRVISADRVNRNFALHPLDAEIAYHEMPPRGPMGRNAVDRRVSEWYASRKTPRTGWRTIDDVEPHRREFEHRVRAGDMNEAAEVLGEISEWLVWHGAVLPAITMHLAIAGRVTDDRALLAHTCGFGHARLSGGPIADALPLFTQATELAERLGDRLTLQHALFGLGDTHRQLGRLGESLDPLRRAAELAHELGEQEREVHAILSLSLSHSYLGDGPAALAGADRLRELAREYDDTFTLARSWNARTTALLVLGRWEETIAAGENAVQAYKASGIPEASGFMRNAQGIANLALGRVPEALAALEEGRRLASEMENPRSEGVSLISLAWGHWVGGDYEQSAATAGRAMAAMQRAGGAAELPLVEGLARAAHARASADLEAAAEALDQAAHSAGRSLEIIPSTWFQTEADRLRSETAR